MEKYVRDKSMEIRQILWTSWRAIMDNILKHFLCNFYHNPHHISEHYYINVTGFAKALHLRTSNFTTLTVHNLKSR